jgi:hypothetical protein
MLKTPASKIRPCVSEDLRSLELARSASFSVWNDADKRRTLYGTSNVVNMTVVNSQKRTLLKHAALFLKKVRGMHTYRLCGTQKRTRERRSWRAQSPE